jgi:hypothetical protein
MGCTSNAVDQAENPRRKARKAVGAISDRAVRLAEFEAFGDEIRQELDPSGALERLLADYVTQTAWRLKMAIERQEPRETDPSNPDARKSSRPRPTAIEAAARAVREAFEAFDACRALKNSRTTSAFVVEVRSEPEVVPPVVEKIELARSPDVRFRGFGHLARRQRDVGYGRPRCLVDRRRLDLGRYPPIPSRTE